MDNRRCVRDDCLHHKGKSGCDLLSEFYDNEYDCKFFCDSSKYDYSKKIYQGVTCVCIERKEKPNE